MSFTKKAMLFLKKQSSGRLICFGFAAIIIMGALLLKLPISINEGMQVSFLDALFTSASAVCVTGLVVVDTAEHFTTFGRMTVAFLIQVGGLGITSVGAGFILAAGKRISIKGRGMIQEALNIKHSKGVVHLVKNILFMSLFFEFVGTIFSFAVFVQDYPPLKALEISIFHSIAAYYNAGFDILGGMQNLIPYQSNVLLNLITCGLIFFGGIGFLVILDLLKARSYQKLCFHSKIVITTSAVLIFLGTILLKTTEDITWLGAFFQSVSARTAGFSTYPIGNFSNAGLFTILILMFIGASPGSTGGGIKTSTFFVLVQSVKSLITKKHPEAFRRSIPKEGISKAYMIALLSLLVVCIGTYFLCILQPELSFLELVFEVTSAFGTVGLSTGITPELCAASKAVLIGLMFIGRLGAFTLASVWTANRASNSRYIEETIIIG